MTGWRYYPLAETPRCGILVRSRGNPSAAEFLTVADARAIAEQKRERLAKRVSRHTGNEIEIDLREMRKATIL